jgi:cytoplasmic iron level regulating protein YaaA (DUF328/UPF0246 family)
MLAVISPSKTQDFETTPKDKFTQPRQVTDSLDLISILREKSPEDLGQLMSISDKLSSLNYDRFQAFSSDFSKTNAKQAIDAFKGDVYNGIDAPSLSPEDLDFAQQHVRMLSGLYGVLRPLDLIQPYRLEMGTQLRNPRGKNLYEFWGSRISEVLNKDEADVIINLASNEYFKGIDKGALNARIIDIVFKENKNNKLKVIGIYAKRARGLMIRYMIDNRIEAPELLKQFNTEGYQFSEELSSDSSFVFTRDI